jgi:hypothetical protein
VAGLNIQDPVNMAVADGDAVILADLTSPDLVKAGCSGVTLALAQSPKMGDPLPKFDGADTFKLGEVMGIKLYGKIEGGKLSTTPSKDQTSADEQRITLQLPIGGTNLLPLSIRGVHIEGTLGMDNKGQPVITDGAIQGVISKTDIDGKIVPTVATLVTNLIHDKPMDSTTATIISLFENMQNDATKAKCMTASKCCKTNPTTCEILPAEVLASPVGGVLSADVEALDASDQWKPTPGGKNKNAMSVGLGFTMIKANF